MKRGLFLSLVVTLLLPCAMAFSEEECSSVTPSQEGWWYVTPIPGYGIAADVPQIMSGTPVTAWENPNVGVTLAGSSESASKKLTWRFTPHHPTGAVYRSLKVSFENSLGGLKVDAQAQTENGATIRLLDERRIFGNDVSVSWPDVRVTSVSLKVHVHLHKRPILKGFQVGYSLPVKLVPGLDAGFQKEGVLYFFNPDGRDLKMCRHVKLSQEIPLSLLKNKIPMEGKIVPAAKE